MRAKLSVGIRACRDIVSTMLMKLFMLFCMYLLYYKKLLFRSSEHFQLSVCVYSICATANIGKTRNCEQFEHKMHSIKDVEIYI